MGVELARCVLATEGLETFAQILGVLRGWQEAYWTPLFPELEDPNEGLPLTRVNCLATLTTEDQNLAKVQSSTLALLKNAELIKGSRIGRVSLRDYQVATGEIEPQSNSTEGASEGESESEDSQPSGIGTIAAVFNDAGAEASVASLQSVKACIEHLTEISKHYDEHLGHGVGPNFNNAVQILRDIEKVIVRYGDVGEETHAEDAAADGDGAGGDGDVVAGGVPGVINSREDAMLALDRICTYFEKHEPSSPVPLMLIRAKGLISKSFIEVLQDLTPDAVHTAEQIVGSQNGGE